MGDQDRLQAIEVKLPRNRMLYQKNTFALLACVSTSLSENLYMYLETATGYAETLKIHEIFCA